MDKYYYEYKDDGDVKYCYPGSQTLINKFDIREGNGRTQRIYCQQLCKNTGRFYLDFSMASETEMLEASVASFVCDYSKMDILIRKCIKEVE